jgi:hypothetical protein
MVVTLAVISIAVVGIAYGFSAVVRGAGNAQLQSELDGAAQTAAGYVQTEQSYQTCASTYSLPSPSPGMAWSVQAVTESQPSPTPGYVGTDCGNGEVDYGVQEITIKISEGSTSVTRVVWKGDQS